MSFVESKKIRNLMLLGIFLLMLLGNFLTPYTADDWGYMFSWATGEKISGLGDLFPSMAAHAQSMNGRLIAHFWAQLFLWLPKALFNIVNAGTFTALIYLVYSLSQDKGRTDNIVLFMVFAAVWVFTPAFGQVFFWLIGSCNYGWGCLVGMIFLMPYIYRLDRDSRHRPLFWVLWMIAGFYTGAYLENVAVTCIVLPVLLLAACVIFRKHTYRSTLLPLLPVLAVIGGLLFMIACPAEGAKTDSSFSLTSIAKGFVGALRNYKELSVLLIAFAVAFTMACYLHVRREKLTLSAVLLLGSLCANFVLSVASYFPERCVSFPTILLVAADAVLLENLFEGKAQIAVSCAAAALIFPLLYWGAYGFSDIVNTYIKVSSNETAIVEAVGRGEESVTVPNVKTLTKYPSLAGEKYLDKTDSRSWPNDSMAKAFGIGEICCGSSEEESDE